MSDSHARLTFPQALDVERPEPKRRSRKMVGAGVLGLVGALFTLLAGTFGRGGLEDPLTLIVMSGVAASSLSSLWLLILGLQEWRQPRQFSAYRTHRAVRADGKDIKQSKGAAEKQLLEVIEANSEITPARAALQTSLTVDEAEQMLSDLAQRGHLDVRVEGSRLVYSL